MRLHLEQRIASYIPIEQILPAVGQGALALECRTDDFLTIERLQPLNHAATFICVSAERALCRHLGGSCQVPLAAFAEIQGGQLELRGLVGSVDGKIILKAQKTRPARSSRVLRCRRLP